MRLATWNVNSVRSRIDRVEAFLQRHDIDVLALQETKARDDQWPTMGLDSLGYEVATYGLNQWNGVAIVSRVGLADVELGFSGMPEFGDPPVAEARAIGATCGGVRMWSLYVPNGRAVGDPHLEYKLRWLAALKEAAAAALQHQPDLPTALAGDWNIAPQDEDVWDMTVFAKSTHVTPPERAAFQAFLDAGFTDVVRPHAPGPGVYTYWDYYRQRFERNKGMRIDFVLGSPALQARVTGAFVDREERAGKGASDHAPVVVELDRLTGSPARTSPGMSARPATHQGHGHLVRTHLLAALVLGVLLGVGLGWFAARARREHRPRRRSAAGAERAVLKDGLDRLQTQLRALEEHGVSWQATLHQQVDDVRRSTELLRRETGALATALRRPQVRGRWGELHLRRAVELAGMVDRCDFDEQVTVRSDGAALRPDLVVNLTGGKQVVVDSKVPLDAFLDVAESDDDDERAAHLARHARQFRQHVDTLAGKSYWRSFAHSPEFVVMFVPGESFLSAALESDASLIEYAAERRVVLATPTTLIALLRTVAFAWTQEALADKAHEIHRLGVDLHGRIATMSGHLDKVGRSLTGAVTSYNSGGGLLGEQGAGLRHGASASSTSPTTSSTGPGR